MTVAQPAEQLLGVIDRATDEVAKLNQLQQVRQLTPLEAVRFRDYRRELQEANQQLETLLGRLGEQLTATRRDAIISVLRRAGNTGLVCLSWIGASHLGAWPFTPGFRPKDDSSSA